MRVADLRIFMRNAISVIMLFMPSIGIACSCAWPEEVTRHYVLDQLCASDAVFVGDVESELVVSDNIFEYKIWPRETFIGRLDSPAFALSETGGSCGYQLKVNTPYLIFANRRADTNFLTVSICGLTRSMTQDDDVYKILSANKNDTDTVCSKAAQHARRLERVREPVRQLKQLEKATREHLESNE